MTLHTHYNKEIFEGFYIYTPSNERYKLRAIHSLGNIDMETRNNISTYDSLVAKIKDSENINRYVTITSSMISGELLFLYMIDLAINNEVETIELPGLVFVSKATRDELNQCRTECFGYYTADEETKEIDIYTGRSTLSALDS